MGPWMLAGVIALVCSPPFVENQALRYRVYLLGAGI